MIQICFKIYMWIYWWTIRNNIVRIKLVTAVHVWTFCKFLYSLAIFLRMWNDKTQILPKYYVTLCINSGICRRQILIKYVNITNVQHLNITKTWGKIKLFFFVQKQRNVFRDQSFANCGNASEGKVDFCAEIEFSYLKWLNWTK